MPAPTPELFAPGMTVAQARRALADAFRQAELDSPELDARLLVGHALGLDHTALTIDSGAQPRRATQRTHWRRSRRGGSTREPVARILGVKEFWGLPLRLNDATLVPRPETETVVEAALAAIDSGGPRTRALRIADLGTGSGALLIALLTELPNASGIGTDVEPRGARGRARQRRPPRHCRADGIRRLRFRRRARRRLRSRGQQPALHRERRNRTLSPEVRHDPRRALDGGADGLDCYRTIAGQAPGLLKPNGDLVVELGIGQEPAVADVVPRGAALHPRRRGPILSGIPRALHARVATMTP